MMYPAVDNILVEYVHEHHSLYKSKCRLYRRGLTGGLVTKTQPNIKSSNSICVAHDSRKQATINHQTSMQEDIRPHKCIMMVRRPMWFSTRTLVILLEGCRTLCSALIDHCRQVAH